MRRQRNRKGFTFAVALFLVAVAGVAMAVVTMLMTADLRRTSEAVVDSQLRQYLLAAAVDVPGHLKAGGSVNYEFAVPGEGQVKVAGSGGDVVISAGNQGRTIGETLRYVMDGNRWKLVSAELATGKSHGR